MKLLNAILTIILAGMLAVGVLSSISCGSGSPLEPTADQPGELAPAVAQSSGSHGVLGVWDFVIEPGLGIVDAIPVRTVEQHFDVTKIALNGHLCPGCIQFQFGAIENGGQQTVTVTLQNSYVGGIAGYDLKGIILADRSTDTSSPYESPWYLLNADDYTNLGSGHVYATTRNPFKAFCPNDPQRRLAVNQTTTLTFQLMFPPAPVDWSRITVGWALDACEVNCQEPYAIENQAVAGGIVPILGETAQVSMNVRDHQSDTATVRLDAVPLGGGGSGGSVLLSNSSGDTWSGSLSASDDTAPGEYTLEIEATDSVETSVMIWDYLKVSVDLTAAQSQLFDDVESIMEDWDEDQVDCVMEELADLLGTNPSVIEDLVLDFISDVEALLNGPDTGATLKWKVLRVLKDLVSDLDDAGVSTTMTDFIDKLAEALDNCLNGGWGWNGNSHNLPGGLCTLDFGVIGGGGMSGQALYVGNSPNCNHIRRYTADYSSNNFYKSLVNLDPAVPNFQPWPVVRLDATNDGAFSWSNNNPDYYDVIEYGFLPIRISNMWCTHDNVPAFHNIPVDDSRIFPVPPPPPESWYTPADVCDDFDLLQYALIVDPAMIVQPHVWGLEGAPDGGDYTKLDDRYGVLFPWNMVGPGDGQIEAGTGDLAGIDAYSTSGSTARLFVAENGAHLALECFQLSDNGPGLGQDTVAWVYTVQFDTQPIDVELLPTNPNYEPNPNCPTVAVLLSSYDGTGYVSLHNACNGTQVQTIGSVQEGCVSHDPAYIDVNDANGDIHVMQYGPTVTVFSLGWIPQS